VTKHIHFAKQHFVYVQSWQSIHVCVGRHNGIKTPALDLHSTVMYAIEICTGQREHCKGWSSSKRPNCQVSGSTGDVEVGV
jgi:hypothetical protein